MSNDGDNTGESKNGKALWILVALAFAILIGAWTALIITAINNQPERIEVDAGP